MRTRTSKGYLKIQGQVKKHGFIYDGGKGGILLLAARRPAGWMAGVSMLAIWLAGYGLLYLLPPTEGVYHGAVRLAMMAAYPLLFLLPARSWVPAGPPGNAETSATSETGVSASPPAQESYEEALLMQSFISSMLEASPEQACRLVNKRSPNT